MDKVAALDLRRMYRDGIRIVVVDGVKFRIVRCGPDNNFLSVSPEDPKRRTPVVNRVYDERKEDARSAAKSARRTDNKTSTIKRYDLRSVKAKPDDG